MKSRILVGALMVVGLSGAGVVAGRGAEVNGARHWTLAQFVTPVTVKDRVIMGPVMIVHDDEKMERGEPCTTFYRFDPARGPREELVSFHCTPIQRAVASSTTFRLVNGPEGACKRLTEYQLAGESESHAIPVK